MKTKLSIFILSLLFICVPSLIFANSGVYSTLHEDIKVAMEDANYKKAKSLVESLMFVLDGDISYTQKALKEEVDEVIVKDLTRRLTRQKEIQKTLKDFLKQRNKNLAEFESLDMIKELRRLSIKPKIR